MLTEKMMEEAIINNPEKYVEEGLSLISRQFRIGNYIFDLLFEDRHGSKLIIELQKGTLDRTHTYKIMDYYDEYKSKNPDQFVELMIIANKITRERRNRLSSYGIAFKEIPESQFPCTISSQAGPSKNPDESVQSPSTQPPIESMPRKGDTFKGKVNDLCQEDASSWRRRDISFFKHEVVSGQRFTYPSQRDQIILKDTDNIRYELKFSKPESDDRVCLGTPGRLKSWYQKNGFNFKVVNADDVIYFEYTGNSNEFLIFTKNQYDRRSSNETS